MKKNLFFVVSEKLGIQFRGSHIKKVENHCIPVGLIFSVKIHISLFLLQYNLFIVYSYEYLKVELLFSYDKMYNW